MIILWTSHYSTSIETKCCERVYDDIIISWTASEWVTALNFVPCTHLSGLRHMVAYERSLSLPQDGQIEAKQVLINISLLKAAKWTLGSLWRRISVWHVLSIYSLPAHCDWFQCSIRGTRKETWLTVWSAVSEPQLKVLCCGYGRHI